MHIMSFFIRWCPPCRDSIPHISKLAQQYKDKNVIVVGITNEQDGEVSYCQGPYVIS
jgi:thiol-disulfide isomerase/thioredoxin